jgi:tetratricopeptide (TPR) repeat protein
VRNRSWAERWHKWRRRRPHALALYGLTFAFLVALAAAGFSAFIQINHRCGEAQQNLITGQEQMAKRDWDGAIRTFTHGINLIDALPLSGELQQDLTSRLQVAKENQLALKFHLVADRIRLQSVADSLTDRDLRDLEVACRTAWSSVHLISQRLGDLEEEDRQSVRRDFLDMAVLGANLHVRLASNDEIRQAREGALQILDEAEAALGPSPVLRGEHKILTDALGLKPDPGKPEGPDTSSLPQTSWEHCARGRAFLQTEKLQAAAREFQEAIRLEPGGLWPNYYAGMCAYRLGHSKKALQAFNVCVGAANYGTSKPVQAQILFDRALANSGTGADRDALEDYNRALESDPSLGKAALNRGLIYFKFKKYQSAIDDLNLALAKGVPPAVIHYNQALIYNAQNKREAALTSARRALEFEPGHKDAQALLKQLTRQP